MRLINPLIIIKILSTILVIETVSFLICLPVSFIYNESPFPFIWSALITVILSVIFFTISRKCDITKVSTRDGFLVVTLSWLLLAGLGSMPYLFSGTIPSCINAFF
jgi:trk system potassium uptake protein TrkH